jgi:hypothetical protein
MVYFKTPRLGCFMACPVMLNFRRDESVFDVAYEEVKKYNEVKQEFDKECERKEVEFKDGLEEKVKAGLVDESEAEEQEARFL